MLEAAAGDAVAARVVDEAADALALACLNYCRMVDPHVIAFAGGVATDDLLRRVRERFDKLRWNILDDPVEIRLAAGGDAGALGAAAAALEAAGGARRRVSLRELTNRILFRRLFISLSRVFCAFSFGAAFCAAALRSSCRGGRARARRLLRRAAAGSRSRRPSAATRASWRQCPSAAAARGRRAPR